MQKPLARLMTGWLLMIAGGGLMLDSGLVELRNSNRSLQAIQALGGFGLAIAGVILRRTAIKRARP